MTLNGHFALNSVLRWYVWSSETWQTLNRKEQLQHCAVSLRQHGFLVLYLSVLFRQQFSKFNNAYYCSRACGSCIISTLKKLPLID